MECSVAKRYLCKLILIFCLLSVSCLAEDTIICATLNKYPYTLYKQDSGPSAFCVDVVMHAAKHGNLNIVLKRGNYKQVVKWLESGEVDCVPFLNDSNSCCSKFDLSAINLLVIQGDIIFKESDSYASYENLHGEKVGFIKDDIAARSFIDQLIGNNIDFSPVWYDNFSVLNNDIIYSKVKYGFVSEYIKSGKVDNHLKRVQSELEPVRIALGFNRKLSKKIVNKLINSVIALKNNYPNIYQELIKKHSSDYGVDYGLIKENPIKLVLTVILLILTLSILCFLFIGLFIKYKKNCKILDSDFFRNCHDLNSVFMNIDIPLFIHKPHMSSNEYFSIINCAAVDCFNNKSRNSNFDDIFELCDSDELITDLISKMKSCESQAFNVRLKNDSDTTFKYELDTQILPSGTAAFSALNNRSEVEALLASLQASQYDLEMAAEAGKVGVFEYDVKSMIMTGSNQCFINLGLEYIEAGISYKDVLKLIVIEDLSEAKRKMQNLVLGKVKTCSVEFKVIINDKTEWLRFDAKVKSRDRDGVAKKIVGVLINIDEIKKLNLELEEFSRNFELIMTTSPDNIYAKDTNYKFIWSSQSLTSELGINNRNDIIGKDDYFTHDKEYADKFIEVEREVIEKGKSIINYEQTYINAKGEQKWVLATKVPIKNTDDKIIGLLGMNKDITKYKNVIKTLNNTQRIQAIGKLAGGIAHEFNNALNGIMGFAHMLQNSKNLTDDERGYIDYILKGTNRCEELTRHFLAFARKGKYVETIVNIHELINKMIEIINLSVTRNVDIQCDFRAMNFLVKGDLNQLENVFINLISNAEYAIKGNGHILIETCNIISDAMNKDLNDIDISLPQSIVIKITDDGVGIAQENIDKIFDPFFTTKEVGEGAGLGLSAVYGIIVNHKGNIGIESDLGKGTCFTIVLPVC